MKSERKIGNGGNLNINATNSVQVIGTSADNRLLSALNTSTNQGSTGNAGDLTIKTQDLLVRDRASIRGYTFLYFFRHEW